MPLGKLRVFLHMLFLENKEQSGRKKNLVMFFYSIENDMQKFRYRYFRILVPIALFSSLSWRGLGTRIVPRPRWLRDEKRAVGMRMQKYLNF